MQPSFLPPRPRRPDVAFLAALLVCFLASKPLRAQNSDDAWLPSAATLSSIADSVGGFSAETLAEAAARGHGRAEHCERSAEAFGCRCVEWRTPQGHFRARSWQRRDDEVVVDELQVDLAGDGRRSFFVSKWRTRASEPRVHHLAGLVARPGADDKMTLSAQSARIGQKRRLDLRALAWSPGRPSQAKRACGWSTPQGVGEPIMRARRARFDGRAWRVEGLELAGQPLPVADFRAEEPGPVSGFLPPQAVWSRDTGSLQAAYLLGRWRLAPEVIVAPARWYGAGLGLMSAARARPDDPPALQPGDDLVDMQLRWSQRTGDMRAAALGRGLWGRPYTHLAASLDEVTDHEFWATDRFARHAFMRPWRLSRVGLALSGPEHALAVRAVHAQPIDPDNLGVDASLAGAELQLAVEHSLGDLATAELEAEHVSLFDGDASAHATRLRAGAERVFGSRGSAYVRPALRSWLQSGFGSRSTGLGTNTNAQLLGMVDAGLSLSGRFDGWTHRVEPGVVAARELVGFSRDVSAASEQAPLVARQPEWTMAGVSLDQHIDVGPAFEFGLPLALFYEGAGVDAAFDERPWGIVGVDMGGRAGFARGRAGARAACPGLGDDILWQASAQMGLGPFDVLYMGGRLPAGLLSPVQWRGAVDDAWSLVDSLQALGASALAAQTPATSHMAGASWAAGRWDVSARAYWTPSADSGGVSLGNTLSFPQLGWSVGVRAAWQNRPGDWGIFVGLGG